MITVKRLGAAVAVAALIPLGVAVSVGAAPASAQTYAVYHTTTDVSARSAPTAAATGAYGAPSGSAVEVQCQIVGEPVGPRGNTLYFSVLYAGRTFYVPDTWTDSPHLAGQPPISGIPLCGSATPPPPQLPATPSKPAANGSYIASSVAVRYCTDTSQSGCGILGPTLATNTSVTMQCWKDASGRRWFYVSAGNGVVGFVPAGYVARQTSVGGCAGNRRITAAEAAASRQGQVWASSADAANFAAGEWAPGPVQEWAGDCPKLPYVAWRAAGIVTQKRDAITNYRYYSGLGQIRSGTPTIGAVVFFDLTSWGHEAVYIGNGMVASTQGLDKTNLPNVITPLSRYSGYLGYYLPA